MRNKKNQIRNDEMMCRCSCSCIPISSSISFQMYVLIEATYGKEEVEGTEAEEKSVARFLSVVRQAVTSWVGTETK